MHNTRLAKKPKFEYRKTIKYKIFDLWTQKILILKIGFFARRENVSGNDAQSIIF